MIGRNTFIQDSKKKTIGGNEMHPDNLQSLSRARKEQQKEGNKMKQFKRQLFHTLKGVSALERSWENLDNHERATVEQVAQETGFDELGNFEEVVNKFKQFSLQMQKTNVIDGYQCWIGEGWLHIIANNNHISLKTLGQVLYTVKTSERVPKETMLKILEWYIEEV